VLRVKVSLVQFLDMIAVLCGVVWGRVLLVRIGLRRNCERRGYEEEEVQVF
jgi:hypothetical protein